ncbi:MAG: iron-containing alcohol dehydrogenase family protein [Candidatus Helarchaeota archaeon]
MIVNFTFHSPKIIFGKDTLNEVPREIKRLGNPVLVVTGKSAMRKTGITDRLEKMLSREDIRYYLMETVDPEPTLEHIEEILAVVEKVRPEVVLALGGGSVIDVSKVVAGVQGHLAKENLNLRAFLGQEITIPGIPVIAVPTTAGTGSEVTKNSVIINKETQVKSSIFRSPLMIPKVAIIDPVLMLKLPPKITAMSGMDALTQAIEAFVTRKENPLCVALALEAIKILGKNLQQAVEHGGKLEIREKMAYGSIISALAFSNSGLGVVHGLAHPLGAYFNAPHGVICAILLPHVMEFNKNTKPERFAQIGKVFMQAEGKSDIEKKSQNEFIEFSIAYIKNLLDTLPIPATLRELGMRRENIPEIVKNTKGSSLNNNPRKAGPEELVQILQNAL